MIDYKNTITLLKPPTYFLKKCKRKQVIKTCKKTGKQKIQLKETRQYLTVNLFYSSSGYGMISEAVNFAKQYLVDETTKQTEIPRLKQIEIDFEIHRPNGKGWDLDNKAGFWKKVFLDVLKDPTKKQVEKQKQGKFNIKSLRVIEDDDANICSKISETYFRGEEKIVINIKGTKECDLFTTKNKNN